MKWKYNLCPGPTDVHPDVLKTFSTNFGSADLEEEFFETYSRTADKLGLFLGTKGANISFLSGEGMVALWGALKSVIRPGDKVLAVSNGIYGTGIGEMAAQCGAVVEYVKFDFNEPFDLKLIEQRVKEVQPSLITAVHCDTPSGVLNDVSGLGSLCRAVGALLYVDFVSSAAAVKVEVDEWGIDLGLLGVQKAFSCPPGIAAVTISERAWPRIQQVQYHGYDALLPFQTALRDRYMPYTHNWHNIAALETSLDLLLAEGPTAVYARHAQVAAYTRQRLEALSCHLVPAVTCSSPSVTAFYLPEGVDAARFQAECRARGILVGGSYGPLANRVARVGHMGVQANLETVRSGLDIIAEVLQKLLVK